MAARLSAPRPAQAQLESLRSLARHYGLLLEFTNMAGHAVPAAPESLIATLRALGVPVERMADCRAALRDARAADRSRPLPPIAVAWNGALDQLPVRRHATRLGKILRLEIQFEDGETIRRDLVPRPHAPRVRGSRQDWIECRLPLPGRWPIGYHRIVIRDGAISSDTLVLAAPRRTYGEPGALRTWGFFSPLYALRSNSNWGAGDFTDLGRFTEWIGKQGGGVAGTLPLLPTFLGDTFDPSPYSPVSRLFWSEFYLDIQSIPELTGCRAARRVLASPRFRERLAALRAATRVNYRELAELKGSLLEILARHQAGTDTPRQRQFEEFIAQHPEASTYAGFRAAQDMHGTDWSAWPTAVNPLAPACEAIDPARRHRHRYSQWIAHEQMAGVARTARRQGVRLYLDLPLGVHPMGYDPWRFQDLFAKNATGGAPPDPVFTRGQDWGFAPINPRALRKDGYGYLRACLAHHMASAGMLRFDHVMSLHRLYWIPEKYPASAGVYVRYPAAELYAVLAIESHRHRAVVVGENLGTVPPEVNRAMARHAVRGMHVTQYELANPRTRLPSPPRSCVASLNTHDMPAFAAFWGGLDISERFALGLLDRNRLKSESHRRKKIRETLARLLGQRKAGAGTTRGVGKVRDGLWAHLSGSAVEVVLANLEDVWLETSPQNLPGTSSARRNWRNKCRFALEQLDRLPDMRRALAALSRRHRGNNNDLPL
jgi:4-alpha-glucanotransferase